MTLRIRIAMLAMTSLTVPALDASAQTVMYKWVDAQGKTQYSDRLPKGFKGEVIRINPDEQPATVAPYQAPRADVKRAEQDPAPASDLAGQKREERRKLEASVSAVRAKLEAAKAALDASGAPQDDERQVVQQRVEKNRPAPGPGSASTGGMLGMGGMLGGAPRSNCTTVKSADGREVTTCPTAVPNDAYYERIGKLEEDVRVAQKELEAAEQAYRRAVE